MLGEVDYKGDVNFHLGKDEEWFEKLMGKKLREIGTERE